MTMLLEQPKQLLWTSLPTVPTNLLSLSLWSTQTAPMQSARVDVIALTDLDADDVMGLAELQRHVPSATQGILVPLEAGQCVKSLVWSPISGRLQVETGWKVASWKEFSWNSSAQLVFITWEHSAAHDGLTADDIDWVKT